MAKAYILKLIKYLIEGIVIAFLALLIQKKLDVIQFLTIGLVVAATLALLDQFSPGVSSGARLGAGFGLGAILVGFPQR